MKDLSLDKEDSNDALAIKEPSVGDKVAPAGRTVRIYFAQPEDTEYCYLWVGLFHPGTLRPHDLYQCTSVNEVFEKAAFDGLAEREPFMLSDTSKSPPRFTYLVPEPGMNQERRWATVNNIVETIKGWVPQPVGIYIAPELFGDRKSQDFLVDLLGHFLMKTSCNDFYLLPGKHGINALLNISLRLKEQFEGQGIDIKVFH